MLLTHRPLLFSLVKSLGDENLEVVKVTQQTLLQLCSCKNGIKRIFEGETLDELRKVMSSSDSCRFHVYELATRVARIFDDYDLDGILDILDRLFAEVSGGDLLTQLNALELVSELSESAFGLRRLRSAGVISKLSYLLTSASTDCMAAFLLPGLLKFFGRLGAAHPHVLAEEEPRALRETMRVACDLGGATDVTVQLIAFETLCHVGASVDGKTLLHKFSAEVEACLKDMAGHLPSLPSDMKVRFLDALAALFHLPRDEQTEDLVSLLESWFLQLSSPSSSSGAGLVFGIARQPFPDLLCAALHLMAALAALPFGLAALAHEPGLLEWLLDRDSCRGKDAKEARFAVVAAIDANPAKNDALDQDLLESVATFCRQGPFFVAAEASVAFHGQP